VSATDITSSATVKLSVVDGDAIPPVMPGISPLLMAPERKNFGLRFGQDHGRRVMEVEMKISDT
jgi:hypothetical protein